MSTESRVTTSSRALAPECTWICVPAKAAFTSAYFVSLPITTWAGFQAKAWVMSRSAWFWAVMTSTENSDGCSAITSKACVPMDPVLPKIAILFIAASPLFVPQNWSTPGDTTRSWPRFQTRLRINARCDSRNRDCVYPFPRNTR